MYRAAARGFTLIEMMIAVAVIGILTAIVLPMYGEYVMRSRLTEAFSALSVAQTGAEQYWSNNRDYSNFNTDPSFPSSSTNFTYALTSASNSAYLITATGRAGALGFTYTVDQAGNHATVAVPTTKGWTLTATCWTDHKSGACTQ